MGKGIHWELCKKLEFDHMNNPEYRPENETQNILWDFEYNQILSRLDDQI